MNVRRIFTMILCSLVTTAFAADRDSASLPGSSREISGADDACYEPACQETNDATGYITFKLEYVFFDHIRVSSVEQESRCVLLKDLPFGGYYKFSVVAMYSKPSDDWREENEEYQLVINGTVCDAIISDQSDDDDTRTGEDVTGQVKYRKDEYIYIRIDHKYQLLHKGDNTINFQYAGPEDPNGARINTLSFYSIELIPPPHIEPEPEFTANYSNTIKWVPILDGAITQDVFYFDTQNNAAKSLVNNRTFQTAQNDTFKFAYFGDLQDKHEYGYYVEAYTTDGAIVQSQRDSSTQDASPPGKVTLNPPHVSSFANRQVELDWCGVTDDVSFVKSYILFRSEDNGSETRVDSIATIAAADACQGCDLDCEENPCYRYIDILPGDYALDKKYKYRVDAVDAVGNRSTGDFSELVINIPAPHIDVRPARVDDKYYPGSTIVLVSNISDSLMPKSSHTIRFQAARDDMAFFEREELKGYFFESGSIPIDETTTAVVDSFDLTATMDGSLTKNFVEGHTYYLRAQLEDKQGNKSAWSKNFSIIPDCFPPNDITSLDVRPTMNADKTEGWMEIKWAGASDLTSGIEKYLIYRKIRDVDADFQLVDSTADEHYKDTFAAIQYNGHVMYRIGSVDRVGNTRDFLATNFVATAWSQTALNCTIIPINGTIEDGVIVTTVRDLFLRCDYSNFEIQEDIMLIPKLNGIEQAPLKPSFGSDDLFLFTLPQVPGLFEISVKVMFPSKDVSLWSRPGIIKLKSADDPGTSKVKEMAKVASTNYPNPFNPSTSISYVLPYDSHVRINVYNIQGRMIKSLRNEYQNKGSYSVIWNGDDETDSAVSSGIYYYKIEIEGQNEEKINMIQRMLLVK